MKKRDERGSSTVEYGLLIAALLIVIMATGPLTHLIGRIYLGAPDCTMASKDDICWEHH